MALILGSTPTNMKNLQIKKTLINRFIQQIEMCSMNPAHFSELSPLFSYTEMGSVNDSNIDSETYVNQLQLSKTVRLPDLLNCTNHEIQIEPVGKVTQQVLDPYEVTCLKGMYENIFSSQEYTVLDVSCLYHQFE